MSLAHKLVFTVFMIGCVNPVLGQSLNPGDLDVLLGDPWKGELEYLDYGNNEKLSIPVEISASKKNGRKYLLRFIYNNEPQANSTEKIKIRKQGAFLNKEEVISRTEESEKLIIKTLADGQDNGRSADFYFTYEFSLDQFVVRKKVVYKGETDGFIRNEFRLSR